jgi:Asp-tRNA(Asn)/Glu-tRNA(Gln) amidotransferase A subunit family amidase
LSELNYRIILMAVSSKASWPKTLGAAHRLVKDRGISVRDLVQQSFKAIQERDELNSFITVR